jgi:putative pyruvate formate lyase activating enzyme
MPASYLSAYARGALQQKVEQAYQLLASCNICPRQCKVNRLKDNLGFCKTGLQPKVYSFLPHHGEEPPISGSRGSGTIFFSYCNMHCLYCQNYAFSQLGEGRQVGPEELAEFMLYLQEAGCHNINLVTPTHVLPQILKALSFAIPRGLTVPLVYNTGGYEESRMIKMLDGIVDIYLADMRYADNAMGLEYSAAPDYPRYNQESVKQMHAQVGVAQGDNQGIIMRGLIIRHLVLPNNISGTQEIMRFIAAELSPDTYVSLMSQYFPCYRAVGIKEIARRITKEEYEAAEEMMHSYGLYQGWVQDAGGLERFAGTNIKPAL